MCGCIETMTPPRSNPVVHLELHTGDLPRARDLYAELCGWRPEWIETRSGSYLAELHAHCYRMLGSVPDAEDALQEALLSVWRGLPRFEGRSSLRSWLYKIATNACLKAIERRPKRVLPIDYGPAADAHDGPGGPLVESIWLEPYPDQQLSLDEGLGGPR